MKREVILKLQQFIIERENADKRRQYKKENEELDLSLTQFHIIELIDNNVLYNRLHFPKFPT
ncbi:hypothetical protein WE084_10270, partial [Staphylococcus aureus]